MQSFEAHCRILLLQHPNERKKYYSTARLVLNSIKNAELYRSLVFDTAEIFKDRDRSKVYLLYPSLQATDCEQVALDKESTVIVIDGTWREARKILFHNPELRDLPTLSFSNPPSSQYRIRKQPKPNCLSTLESVGYLLKRNASVSGSEYLNSQYDRLFALFNRMVEKQISFFPRNRDTLSSHLAK